MEDNAIAIFLSAKEGISDQEIKEKLKVIRFFKGKLSKEEMDKYKLTYETKGEHEEKMSKMIERIDNLNIKVAKCKLLREVEEDFRSSGRVESEDEKVSLMKAKLILLKKK